MSLADYPFRDEYDDAVTRLHNPIYYGDGIVEGDPDHAPYSDDQFAYFSDHLAYLNELPADKYYQDHNVAMRGRINVWLNHYAQFIFAC
jgi:hypothetical protein